MNITIIILGIIFYLMFGGFLANWAEDKDYLEITNNWGYVIFSVIWLLIIIILVPIILGMFLYKKVSGR